MLEKIYYKNSNNDIFEFGTNGIFANYNDLRDYKWEFNSDNNVITNFNKSVLTKSIPVIFTKNANENRNKLFLIAETDVKANKKGKLYIGNYFLNCFISGFENSNYLENDLIYSTLTVITDDTEWHCESTIQYLPGSIESVGGFEYPFDFPFDFRSTPAFPDVLYNEFNFDCDFILTFYGNASNPQIKINDLIYKVTAELLSTEKIVINSKQKTVYKIDEQNNIENYFSKRYKKNSVFAKIPSGTSNIQWDGSFGFKLNLIDDRSEPKWSEVVI